MFHCNSSEYEVTGSININRYFLSTETPPLSPEDHDNPPTRHTYSTDHII